MTAAYELYSGAQPFEEVSTWVSVSSSCLGLVEEGCGLGTSESSSFSRYVAGPSLYIALHGRIGTLAGMTSSERLDFPG